MLKTRIVHEKAHEPREDRDLREKRGAGVKFFASCLRI